MVADVVESSDSKEQHRRQMVGWWLMLGCRKYTEISYGIEDKQDERRARFRGYILLADYGRYTRDINRDPYLHFQEISACDSEDEARYATKSRECNFNVLADQRQYFIS